MTRTNLLTLAALAVAIPSVISVASLARAQLVPGAGELPAHAQTLPGEGADWVASAPGRVEPMGGDIAIGATMMGRILAVQAEQGQVVSRGDILVQLEDEGATARFQATKVEAARAKKDRDDIGGGDIEYRTTEDDIVNAELAFWNARDSLDRAAGKRRKGENAPADVDAARKAYIVAEDLLATKRNALTDLQARKRRPVPNKQESALANARSEQSAAAAMLDKTRIRAPIDGTVLDLDARAGEVVAPSPELALLRIGNTAKLRVKAELDERDVSRVKVGQPAVVRADAFQGQDFIGRVTTVAPALTSPGLKDRGAARRSDVDVLEIFVDLEGNTPLIPGLRVDVFFKPLAPATAAAGAAAKPKTP